MVYSVGYCATIDHHEGKERVQQDITSYDCRKHRNENRYEIDTKTARTPGEKNCVAHGMLPTSSRAVFVTVSVAVFSPVSSEVFVTVVVGSGLCRCTFQLQPRIKLLLPEKHESEDPNYLNLLLFGLLVAFLFCNIRAWYRSYLRSCASAADEMSNMFSRLKKHNFFREGHTAVRFWTKQSVGLGRPCAIMRRFALPASVSSELIECNWCRSLSWLGGKLGRRVSASKNTANAARLIAARRDADRSGRNTLQAVAGVTDDITRAAVRGDESRSISVGRGARRGANPSGRWSTPLENVATLHEEARGSKGVAFPETELTLLLTDIAGARWRAGYADVRSSQRQQSVVTFTLHLKPCAAAAKAPFAGAAWEWQAGAE